MSAILARINKVVLQDHVQHPHRPLIPKFRRNGELLHKDFCLPDCQLGGRPAKYGVSSLICMSMLPIPAECHQHTEPEAKVH